MADNPSNLFVMTEQGSLMENPADSSGRPARDKSETRYSLGSVTRALSLLNVLATAGADGLSLTEAAREVGASKSATYALLQTLTEMDYATSFDRGPRYRLGPAVVHLADNYSEALPWLDVARPIARQLTADTGWTSRLASHIDGHPVFQERVDGPGMVRFFTQLGIRELPHVSSAGKAILSQMPEAKARAVISETGLPARTNNTITDVEVLLRDLRQAAVRGYALDDEEDDLGVFCIASPFSSASSEVVGAISITGLKATIPDWQVAELGARVLSAANQIAVAIGGRPVVPAHAGPKRGDVQ